MAEVPDDFDGQARPPGGASDIGADESGAAASTSLGVSPPAAPPGVVVTATWSGIPSASATDWVGLFAPGAPNEDYLAWVYVSGSQSAATPRPSGSCVFVIPNVAPGPYEMRLLTNDGYTHIATSNLITIEGTATVTVNPARVQAGGTVTVTWSGIPSPSATDWLGLYTPGSSNAAYIVWSYVSGSTIPGSPRPSGSSGLVIPAEVTPGTYEIRLLANDGFTSLADSNGLTVVTAE